MRLALVHARASLLALARYPAFAVPTVLLPTLFFCLFGLPQQQVSHAALTASFTAYAVLTVVFFLFGVGIAAERDAPWESFLRTLPVRLAVRFAGRVLSALAFALVSAGLVLLTAAAASFSSLGATEWARFALALLAGAVPLSLLGIALGYWVPAKGALPVANVVYLLCSYAGGLWTGPRHLPSAAAAIAPYLPTRQWGEVLWPAVEGRPWHAVHWLALLGFSCAFAALAAWGYRRDEGQHFS